MTDDANIVICCKLRESFRESRCTWDCGIFMKLYGRKRGARLRVGARPPRDASYDYRFSRAFTREYPRGKVKSCTSSPCSSKQISCSPGNTREYTSEICIHVVSDKRVSARLPSRIKASLYLYKNRVVLSVEIDANGSRWREFV